MYEMLTTSEGMMGASSESMLRIFIKKDYSRTEVATKSQMAGEQAIINIIRLDKELMWTLIPEEKAYTEMKFDDIKAAFEGEEGEAEVKPEFNVEKTGQKKKILNKDCEKIIVSMKAESEEGGVNFTQTMWVAKDIPGYQEIKSFQDKLMKTGIQSSASSVLGGSKKSFEEFQKKISEIEGFPLEIDIEMTFGAEEMTFTVKTHSTITRIDAKPINKKVFEIPIGYTLKKE
jgi:hypothetical protein